MKRQDIERQIARKLVDDAIAAGFVIDVYDGEDFPIEKSADAEAITAAMFSTDDDRLYFHKDGQMYGWVWLIYGNSGWDVMSDYTVNLKSVVKGAYELSEQLEAKVDG